VHLRYLQLVFVHFARVLVLDVRVAERHSALVLEETSLVS
jgi:hypothetical protein